MKRFLIALMSLVLLFAGVQPALAQEGDGIWLNSNNAVFSGGETLRVMVLAKSSTPVQGFTFRLNYDPECLQVASSASMLPQLTNMSLKQEPGVVEGIYTSVEPISPNGELVEVKFTGIKECSTSLQLVDASLMTLNADRIAVALDGIEVSQAMINVAYKSAGEAANSTVESVAALATPAEEAQGSSPAQAWLNPLTQYVVGGSVAVLALVLLAAWLVSMLLRKRKPKTPVMDQPIRAGAGAIGGWEQAIRPSGIAKPQNHTPAEQRSKVFPSGTSAYITIQRGIQAGTRVRLSQFPCSLGYSPANDVHLEDPSIAAFHAKIYADKAGFNLVDLGNAYGTYINGKFYQNQVVAIRSGDVIKIGSIIMSFTVM